MRFKDGLGAEVGTTFNAKENCQSPRQIYAIAFLKSGVLVGRGGCRKFLRGGVGGTVNKSYTTVGEGPQKRVGAGGGYAARRKLLIL